MKDSKLWKATIDHALYKHDEEKNILLYIEYCPKIPAPSMTGHLPVKLQMMWTDPFQEFLSRSQDTKIYGILNLISEIIFSTIL